MAVKFICGCEAQEQTADGFLLSGTASYSTSTVRTGAAAVRCNPASAANGFITNFGVGSEYLHLAVNVASLPSVDRIFASAQIGRAHV